MPTKKPAPKKTVRPVILRCVNGHEAPRPRQLSLLALGAVKCERCGKPMRPIRKPAGKTAQPNT